MNQKVVGTRLGKLEIYNPVGIVRENNAGTLAVFWRRPGRNLGANNIRNRPSEQ